MPTIYNSARQLFARSAHPGRLVGRENERAELRDFLQDRATSKSGGCLYVSGPPGTGKSALVKEVCNEFKSVDGIKMAYVNCMSVNDAKDMFGKLVEDLCPDMVHLETSPRALLQRLFAPKKRKRSIYVVALDEIDHLLTLELEVVYTLFEWSLQKASQLVLVGIANALDFTDRFLPRLKARNLIPRLLPFLPYAAPQIDSVITNKLRSLLPSDTSAPVDFVPFINPTATQLCARKVASQTGDIRRAFDICRRAIDLVEGETRRKYDQQQQQQQQSIDEPDPSRLLFVSPSRGPLAENANLSSSPSNQSPMQSPCRGSTSRKTVPEGLRTLTPETAPRATIAHVARISAASFGHGVSQRLQTLNLQQKAVLCALVSLEKKKRVLMTDVTATPSKTDRGAPTVRALFEMYASLCKRDGMLHPLTGTEFRDVLGSLETLSLINAIDGRNSSNLFFSSPTTTFSRMGTPSKRGRGTAMGFGGPIGDDRRIGSCVSEKELEATIEGIAGAGILRGLLAEDDF